MGFIMIDLKVVLDLRDSCLWHGPMLHETQTPVLRFVWVKKSIVCSGCLMRHDAHLHATGVGSPSDVSNQIASAISAGLTRYGSCPRSDGKEA
jgi:hypothetical protein